MNDPINKMQIFENPEFGQVRTIIRDGEPWFVGKDVAAAIGYGRGKSLNNAVSDHVDCADKGVAKIVTPGGEQSVVIINESGLYAMIFRSTLESAKRFKHWVTSEVLPSIRKTGSYQQTPNLITLDKEELMVMISKMISETIGKLTGQVRALEADNSRLAAEKKIMAPKADYFDTLVDRNLLTNFRETAKQLGVKEMALIGFLVEHKYLYRDGKGKLMPYANKNEGYFEIKECVNEKTGWAGAQTLITPKGREAMRLFSQWL